MIYRSATGRAAVEREYARWLATIPEPVRSRRIPTRFGEAHVLSVDPSSERDRPSTVAGEPAIIALAGTNFPAVACGPLFPLAERGFRVFAVDLIGQPGRSEGIRLAPSRAEAVEWLEEVMDGLALPIAHFVGHSLGGHLALRFAAARPPRVGRVALICPSGLMRLRVPSGVLRRTVAWLARPNRGTSRALLRVMSEAGSDVEDLVPWMSAVGRHVRTSLAPRPLPDAVLRAIGRPVLVIAGEVDPFLPGHRLARTAKRELPLARTVVVAGGSHLLPHDRPAEMLRLLIDLLDGDGVDEGDRPCL